MTGTKPLAQSAAAISHLMNAEVEWDSGIWSFRKKRMVKLEDRTSGYQVSLNMEVFFYETQNGGSAVNLAELLLLSE
ncbi:hypothetical protein [Metaplanococcus flavidus]|uniref:Uncharacterized protein n=1 Tax=Metaplanococcus flavidus TaxID=569883 RepID=A0ABW3L7X5_9BACL